MARRISLAGGDPFDEPVGDARRLVGAVAVEGQRLALPLPAEVRLGGAAPAPQSTLRASRGSTPVARVTGTAVATRATRIMTPAAPAMWPGLKGLMP